jgi:hypothetical protein
MKASVSQYKIEEEDHGRWNCTASHPCGNFWNAGFYSTKMRLDRE